MECPEHFLVMPRMRNEGLCGQCECNFYQFLAGIRVTDLGDRRLNHVGVTLYQFSKFMF